MEMNRTIFLKSIFKSFIDLMSTLIYASPEYYGSVLKTIEECNQIQDFSWILSNYRTGWERPSTFLYISRYHHFARDQLFGVDLESFTKTRKIDFPEMIEICTRAIETAYYESDRDFSGKTMIRTDQRLYYQCRY